MNKEAFVLAVAELTGENIDSTSTAVDAMLKVMVHTVAGGEAIRMTGWGTIEPVIRSKRTARDPNTGGPLAVPEKIAVRFSAADRFAQYTNEERPLPASAADVELKTSRWTLGSAFAPQAPEQGTP